MSLNDTVSFPDILQTSLMISETHGQSWAAQGSDIHIYINRDERDIYTVLAMADHHSNTHTASWLHIAAVHNPIHSFTWNKPCVTSMDHRIDLNNYMNSEFRRF